jgi:GTPase SAR1 family protein
MRVILLGIGGSGKSTFSKQMKIIHQGINPEIAKTYRGVLLTNILLGLKAIGSEKQDLESTENYKKSRWILSLDENNVDGWNDEIINRIKALWLDVGVHETWEAIKDTTLIQLDYLMDNLDRYLQPDFIPSYEDILRARQRSTGVSTYTIEEERTTWQLTDVGGQYSERSKWGNFFNEKNPNVIIFFLALDEYNIQNTELKTEHKTKFDLALSVFTEILCGDGPVVDHKLFRIVFLNKVDLFEEKLRDDKKWVDFKTIMNYNGQRSVTECTKCIEEKLRDINRKLLKDTHPDDMELSIHVTNALDTEGMKKVSEDIKSSIITSTLKDFGII